MASSSAIRAGKAFVELFTEDSKLVRGLKSASKKVKGWGKSVTAVGAKIFAGGAALKGALAGAATVFEEVGTGLLHMSERTGVSVESLSALSYAADQSGVDLETLEGGFRKMQKAVGQASIGNEEAAKAFSNIGLSAQDLINLAPEEQFKLIADRIAGIANPAQRAAATMAIFGKTGTALLPLLAQGSKGINDLMGRAGELGLVMSTEDAEAAAKLHGAMKDVWATLKAATVQIGSALAPALTDLATKIAAGVSKAIAWVKQNKGLIVTLSTVGTVIVAAGAAIIGLGYALTAVGTIFGVLSTIISVGGAVIGGVFSALSAAVTFLLSPIGLIVLAVGAMGFAIAMALDAPQKALAVLGEAVGTLKDDFGIAFGAIKAALGAGDFAAAARVLWAVLKLEWARGIAALNEIWTTASTYFLEGWEGAVSAASGFFIRGFHVIQCVWIDIVADMQSAWFKLTSSMVDALKGPLAGFASIAARIGAKLKGMDDETANRMADLAGIGTRAALAGVAAEQGGAAIDVEKERNAAQAKNKKEMADTLGANKDALQAKLDELERKKQTAKDGNLAQLQADVDKAKADLVAAADAANAAKTQVAKGLKPAGRAAEETKIQVAKKESSAGTFNAFGARGFGPSQAALDKIAAHTQRQIQLQAENNKLIKDMVDDMYPKFD